MNIAFYLESGSPSFRFIPSDVYGRGVGGAEKGLIDLTTELAKRHTVTVFNSGTPGVYSGVVYSSVDSFDPAIPYDVFVLFRNPSPALFYSTAPVKIFWSCDQMTVGNYARDILPYVHQVVCISPYHQAYFRRQYGLSEKRSTVIDLGVTTGEYLAVASGEMIERVPGRLLYCSVPDRGLRHLKELFPAIRFFCPGAELYITSDYSLWGEGLLPNNESYRQAFSEIEGVHFLGKVPRKQLVELQLSSEVMAYPNEPSGGLSELFCISAAECQVAGAIPVTGLFGALPTTVMNGKKIEGLPGTQEYNIRFIEAVSQLLSDRGLSRQVRTVMRDMAIKRFNYTWIGKQWDSLLNRLTNSVSTTA